MADVVFVLGGLLGLVVGASLLVGGASRIALRLNVSPLVVGLTVVAFGTSAPELFVSVRATLGGQPDIAIGNVVGSSIFNILVILGLSALVTPLAVQRRLTRYEVPILLAATATSWVLVLDGTLSVADSLMLCGGAVLYFAAMIFFSLKSQAEPDAADVPATTEAWPVSVLRVGFGLGLLVVGSEWLVQGAASIAVALGIDELMVGVVVIAAGTSFPELATSLIAAMRGERDIAVGNVVGSNLFNLLVVLGASGAVSGVGLQFPAQALLLDVPVMVGAAVLCLPVVITGARISRFEGGLFVCFFLLYLTALILASTGNPLAGQVGFFARWWVVPAVALVLCGSLVRSYNAVGAIIRKGEGVLNEATTRSMRHLKTVVVAVTGGTLVVVGMLLFFTPLPGVLVVGLGLGILGVEFAWAKRLLLAMQAQAGRLLKRVRPDTRPD